MYKETFWKENNAFKKLEENKNDDKEEGKKLRSIRVFLFR